MLELESEAIPKVPMVYEADIREFQNETMPRITELL